MPFPALLPFLAAAGRVLGNAGARAATAAIGKQGLSAIANLRNAGAVSSAGQQSVAQSVTQGGMANLIARSSSFGNIMSGQRPAMQEASDQQQAENDRAAAEGIERRKEAEEQVVRSAVLVTGAMTGLGVAVLKMPSMLERFARSTLAGQEGLRRFNGQINNAFAKLEFQDIVRSRNTANATSGSTKMLADATNQMADNLQDIKVAGITAMNLIGVLAAHGGSLLAWAIKNGTALGAIMKLLGLIEKNTSKGAGQRIDNFIDDIAEGKFSGMKRDRVTQNAAGPRK